MERKMGPGVRLAGRSSIRDHLRWAYLRMLLSASLGAFLVGFNKIFLIGILPLVKSEPDLAKNRAFESSMLFLGLLGRATGMVISICKIDSCGRRNIMYWSAVMLGVGVGLSLLFPWITTMMFGRFIIEVAAGAVDTTTPVYISEITPYRVRGMGMTLQLVPETVGHVLGHYIKVAMKKVLGSWKVFVLIEGILSIAYICALFTVLDTPRFLYRQAMMDMDVDKYNEAVDLVRRICPPQDAELELESLQSGVEEEIEERGSLVDDRHDNPLSKVWRAWNEEATRSAMLTWLLYSSFPQICGMNVVVQISSVVARMVGISKELADLHKSLLVGSLKIIGSTMGACFLDIYEISRKEVVQASFLGMIMALGWISVLSRGKSNLPLFYALLALGALVLCVGCFYIGNGVVATITEEACPFRYRGVSTGAVWINSVICKQIIGETILLFGAEPNLTALFGALCFWNIILLGIVSRYVPKTTAMPLELGWRELKDLKRTKARRYAAQL